MSAAFQQQEFAREIGRRVFVARKRLNLDQGELAREAGTNRGTIGLIENGKRDVSVAVLWRVAIVLGVPFVSLVPEPASVRTAAPPGHTP